VQVWTFTDWVQAELDPVLEELSQMPAPRVGFHIRGGDKLSEDVQLVTASPLSPLHACMQHTISPTVA
jgi:hypothetical protein